jgi:hypothetical protein
MQGTERDRMRQFLDNWLIMIGSVSRQLIKQNFVSEEELSAAKAEASIIDDQMFLEQRLMISEGNV